MQVNGFFKKWRLIFLGVGVALLTLYVLAKFAALALTPVKSPEPVRSRVERGSILDRNGKPLAVSTNFYDVAVTPSVFKRYLPDTASQFARILGISAEDISGMVLNARGNFLYLKKKVDESTKDRLEAVITREGVQGIRLDKVPGRIYPENALASQVIGFMGTSGAGLSGLEYELQSILSPQEAVPDKALPVESVDRGEQGEIILRGKNVYLTIDSSLQYKLEKIARNTMETTQAESVMLIAAEAKTGEIISYISLPSANLNTYPSSTVEQQVDRPAVYAYEPGSVFKVFSVASFLDAGGITSENRFLCDGRWEISGSSGEHAVINCLEHHGWLTAREALSYSCNDALAQMSQTIPADTFLRYIRAFGFGSKTGVERPGETRGSVKNTDDKLWSIRSKPTMAIGQEISVSALQIVQAATAIANQGSPMQLTLVSKIVDASGAAEYEHVPAFKEPVISASVADYILSCMETTAESGNGARASIGDVSIGVKTGTAQMLDEVKGGYSETDFVSNCLAIFPVENPQIVLYIVVTKAQGETYAGRIVAPVIREAADTIIDHLGMARAGAKTFVHNGEITFYTGQPKDVAATVPDFTGTPKRLLAPLLIRDDLEVLIQGDGYVVSQSPPAGTPVTENMRIELYLQ